MDDQHIEQDSSHPYLYVYTYGLLRLERNSSLRASESSTSVVSQTEWEERPGPTLALLKLLLCCENRHGAKGYLAGTLWPDTEEEKARHSLAQASRVLRGVLRTPDGKSLLIETSGGSGLQLAGQTNLWVDADAFEQEVREAIRAEHVGRKDKGLLHWERAYTLGHAGTFLPGDIYQEWANARRLNQDRLYRRCVHRLGERYLSQERYDDAEAVLRSFWVSHLTDEDILFLLIKVAIGRGDRSEALWYYGRTKQVLQDELGVQPLSSTTALVEQLCTNAASRLLPLPSFLTSQQIQQEGATSLHSLAVQAHLMETEEQRRSRPAEHGTLQPTALEGQTTFLLLPSTTQKQLIVSGVALSLSETSSSTQLVNGVALLTPTLSSTDELLDRFIRAMEKPSTINETTLRYLEARTDGYWKDHYDAIFAASDLLSDVLSQFQKVTSLLENSLLPTVRTRLCASASRIAQFTGALYFDMGNYTYSKRYRQVAILAAREAKHQELEAVAWGRLSMTCMYGNQLQDALINIQEARRLATQSSSFRVHAWLAAVEAEIQAKLGNREACLRALDAAECVENIQPSDQDYHWLHFDRPSLIGFQGACYRRLYHPDDPQTHGFLEDARKALLTTLSLPTLTQRQPVTLADLADTYMLQGEVGEACKLASQAVAMIAELQSGRNLQRLHTLRRDMEPWKDTRDVQNLDRQLTALDEQLVPLFS